MLLLTSGSSSPAAQISVALVGFDSGSTSLLFARTILFRLNCPANEAQCEELFLLVPDDWQWEYESIAKDYTSFNVTVSYRNATAPPLEAFGSTVYYVDSYDAAWRYLRHTAASLVCLPACLLACC
jgi:hypothetical protein